MSYAEALAALRGEGAIARDDVRRWIDSGDLLTWSVVYTLTDSAWSRIQPEIPAEEQVEFMRRYLLRCIDENPTPGDYLHGGYEAAWDLAACMKRWRQLGGRAAGALRGVAIDLEKLYRRADVATQNRIICGVLEHAFEDPALRPFFASWDRDCDLREAHKLAMEWGAEHEGE
ncbi:MAG TPA: hypothetical protein VM733_08605 [Thermoanaerobaculia bacterium]|nr:hypothetical protein [Thermoanaerobaculia bacterium]